MAENAPVTLIPGTLPEGFCFQTWQQTYSAFITLTTAFLPGAYTTVNAGSTEPAPEDRGKPWFRYNNDGSPDRWYIYFGGSWVSPFSLPYDNKTLYIYIGTTTDLKTKDGGEDAPITTKTGPFWEVDSTIAAKFPLPVGTLPSGTSVALASTGGEEKHALTDAEGAVHTHTSAVPFTNTDGWGGGVIGSGSLPVDGTATANTDSVSSLGTAHNNMPPYYGVYLIKRSARIYYRV
jgi:hypothetical protein